MGAFRLLLKTLFHGGNLCLYIFAGIKAGEFMEKVYKLDTDENMVYCMKHYPAFYVTHWSLMFQVVYTIMAFVMDLADWCNQESSVFMKKLRRFSNIWFSSLYVPAALMVSIIFWSVYFYDRELMYPRVYDQEVPHWFNHILHTNLYIFFFIETLLESRRQPEDVKTENRLRTIFSVFYITTYHTIQFLTGRHLYNFVGILNWWQVIILDTGLVLLTTTLYRLQFPFNRLFHVPEVIEENNTKYIVPIDKNGLKIENNGKDITVNENKEKYLIEIGNKEKDIIEIENKKNEVLNGTANSKANEVINKEFAELGGINGLVNKAEEKPHIKFHYLDNKMEDNFNVDVSLLRKRFEKSIK